jgi:hypothetical protein
MRVAHMMFPLQMSIYRLRCHEIGRFPRPTGDARRKRSLQSGAQIHLDTGVVSPLLLRQSTPSDRASRGTESRMNVQLIGSDGLRFGTALVPAGASCSSCCHCWTCCCSSCAAVGFTGSACEVLDSEELHGGLVLV